VLTEEINYHRIEKAIVFIRNNFTSQPDLELVAAHVQLSPFHFQKMFSEWAGVSPKKFLQYLTVEYSKGLLREQQMSLFDTAHKSGLSGTGRLHDLFVKIEGMTPAEFKNGGSELLIHYTFAPSVFGQVLIASTSSGICYLAFTDDNEKQLKELLAMFPNADLQHCKDPQHSNALRFLTDHKSSVNEIRLHLKGSPFQLKVWNALLNIKEGNLSTYGKISSDIQLPRSARAVGTAIGSNPVAFIIPCHRVVQGGGSYGQYRWGENRKRIMIGWEAAHKFSSQLAGNSDE
jgi:AraC family transcriptional regulator of adaptative response/methylated-DNA-[protein]-cysteine methyltransferase